MSPGSLAMPPSEHSGFEPVCPSVCVGGVRACCSHFAEEETEAAPPPSPQSQFPAASGWSPSNFLPRRTGCSPCLPPTAPDTSGLSAPLGKAALGSMHQEFNVAQSILPATSSELISFVLRCLCLNLFKFCRHTLGRKVAKYPKAVKGFCGWDTRSLNMSSSCCLLCTHGPLLWDGDQFMNDEAAG